MANQTSLTVQLRALDGLYLPSSADPSRAHYKEWQHFCLLDEQNGLHAIFNLNLVGSLNRKVRVGAGRVVSAVWQHHHGWQGDVEPVSPQDIKLENRQIDLRLGSTSLRFDGTRYVLNLSASHGAIRGDLNFTPVTAPLMSRNNTPLGSGYLNWLVVPALQVDGQLQIRDRCYEIRDGKGYHDHNWGRWDWGDDLAWEWGFAVPSGATAERLLTFVFHRATDRKRLVVKELTLAVWERDALARVFTRRDIAVRSEGFLERRRLLKLPRIMSLIEPQRTHEIPAVLGITARTGADYLGAWFRSDQAIQIVVPNDTNLENTIINEVFGGFTARGQIRGAPTEFSGAGFFEFLT